MTWVQSILVAALLVLTVYYSVRTVALHRAGLPAWRRWALVTALFAVAFIVNAVALALQA